MASLSEPQPASTGFPATRYQPGSLRSDLAAVWRYRELIRNLVVRNLKVKYQRSVLGFVWTLLNPLLTVGVMVAVFGYVLRVPVEHYWAFLFSSYFVWNFVFQTLSSSTTLLAQHSSLLRSVAVPSEVLVLAAAIARLVEFFIEKGLAVLAIALFHFHAVPSGMVLLPVLVLVQLGLTLGLVWPVATLSVFYDDVQHALPVALLLLFYLSPVLYPSSLVPEALQQAYYVNPIAGLLTLYQTVLYEGLWPTPGLFAWTTGTAVVLSAVGYAIFRRYRSVFPEIL
jgi:lipopolysaccharide transport system permease protein